MKCLNCEKESGNKKYCNRTCAMKFYTHKSYLKNKDKVFARVRERRKTNEYKELMQKKRRTSEYKEWMKNYRMRWLHSEKGKEIARKIKKKYDRSEKGKASIRKRLTGDKWKKYIQEYSNDPINKKRLNDWKKEWAKSKEGKIMLRKADKKYYQTEHGLMKTRLKCAKRRSLKKNIIHRFDKDEWDYKLKSTNGICLRCNVIVGINKLTLDHIIPISSGLKKEYFIEDVQPLCKSCNSSKRDKIISVSYE